MKTVKEMVMNLFGGIVIEKGGIVKSDSSTLSHEYPEPKINTKDYMNKYTSSLYNDENFISDSKKLDGLMKINNIMIKIIIANNTKEFYNPIPATKEVFNLCEQGYVSCDKMDDLLNFVDDYIDNWK